MTGGEQDARPANNSPDWRMLAKLLDAGQYERAAGLLERAQATSQERGDTVLSHVLDAVRYICLACVQLQTEAQWHSRARAEVDRREEELRQELQAIFGLLGEAGALAAASGRENPEAHLSLWQRIQGLLGRGGAPQWSQLGLSAITGALIAGDAGPLAVSGSVPDSEEQAAELFPSSPESTGTPDSLSVLPGQQGPTPVAGTASPPSTPGHEAHLGEAHLEEALMEEELATGFPSTEAPLEGMPLTEAMLEEKFLNEVNLTGAGPEEARFQEADLEEAMTEEGPITGSPGAEAPLKETSIGQASLEEAMAEEELVPRSPDTEISLEEMPRRGMDFEEADLAGALAIEMLAAETFPTPSAAKDALSTEADLAGTPACKALDRDPALPVAPSLVVYTLGSFRVHVDGQPVEDWAGRRCRSILKYLLIHRAQPTHAEVLMDVFWPDAEPKSARRNLYQAIYQLRQSLQAGEPDLQYIVYEDGRYALNPDVHVWVDSEVFMQHYQAAQQLAREGQVDEAVGEYEAAESLYEGEFLAEDRYEEWSLVLRENLRHAHLDILDRLSEYYFEHAQYAMCVTFCQAILAEDSCREDTHRRLMRCYMGQGQRHLALRQYHLCTEALKEELDVSPMPATVDLYLQIQNHPTLFPET